MKLVKFILIFITLGSSIKAEISKNLIKELENGDKLIFIRHAHAPGGGDRLNFDINDCTTQRNLSESGKKQAKKTLNYYNINKIAQF